MKIVAPISRLAELEPVLQAGADELYFGMVPEDWTKKFGISNASRRMFGNITDYGEMRKIIALTREAGKQAMLTLNAQHYTEQQANCLIDLAKRFSDEGGTAIILADAPLLAELSSLNLHARLHLSSIAACRNTEAARLFQSLGADRIIFPRYMQLREIAEMISAEPTLEYEAFVLNDGCIYEEGVCHTIHLPQQYGGPICMDNYRHSLYRSDGREIDAKEQQRLSENEKDYAEWIWYKFSCGFATSKNGYTFGPCGICAIGQLHRAGLTAIKIAGREAPLPRKIKSIALVRNVRDRVLQRDCDSTILGDAQQIRERPDLCQSGYMCYYPEVLDNEPARADGL